MSTMTVFKFATPDGAEQALNLAEVARLEAVRSQRKAEPARRDRARIQALFSLRQKFGIGVGVPFHWVQFICGFDAQEGFDTGYSGNGERHDPYF